MELVFRSNPYARSCTATVADASAAGIVLDRTVFYPAGGGQPGDTGRLVLPDGSALPVLDTVKGAAADSICHVVPADAALPLPGTPVTAELDWERRHRHMRMHTCLHLLCASVAGGVTGGQISDGKGRLDFDIEASPDKDALTATLNRLIEADLPVSIQEITGAELDANPELVRTMSVKPPRGGDGLIRTIAIHETDLQPCGGTHVQRTGEIGPVVVTKIENKGKRNRRINVAFAE
jgi:misacylated tRNA(Ala) deacylase